MEEKQCFLQDPVQCVQMTHKVVNYEGETGCNCYSRGLEHQDGLRNEQEDNPLWKHCTLEHGGEKVEQGGEREPDEINYMDNFLHSRTFM